MGWRMSKFYCISDVSRRVCNVSCTLHAHSRFKSACSPKHPVLRNLCPFSVLLLCFTCDLPSCLLLPQWSGFWKATLLSFSCHLRHRDEPTLSVTKKAPPFRPSLGASSRGEASSSLSVSSSRSPQSHSHAASGASTSIGAHSDMDSEEKRRRLREVEVRTLAFLQASASWISCFSCLDPLFFFFFLLLLEASL